MINHIDEDDDSLDQFAAMYAARKAAAPKAVASLRGRRTRDSLHITQDGTTLPNWHLPLEPAQASTRTDRIACGN